MTYERMFGKEEGLEERLAMWVDRLSHDKQLPWVGLGLIDDLKISRKLIADLNCEKEWDL